MNSLKKMFLLSVLIFVAAVTASAGKDETEINGLFKKNLDAYNNENIENVTSTINIHSPGFSSTIRVTKMLFKNYDLKYSYSNLRLLNITDDGFALVRVSIKTEKVKGPAFKNNILDSLQICKKDSRGKWKLWSSAILNIKYLTP